jgi:hypothetical protein
VRSACRRFRTLKVAAKRGSKLTAPVPADKVLLVPETHLGRAFDNLQSGDFASFKVLLRPFHKSFVFF